MNLAMETETIQFLSFKRLNNMHTSFKNIFRKMFKN